ncbi:MAG: ribosome recycling factor [Elusimicrobiota bacterium]|nr:ribosome recycling factor [Elusimicrobiota bacterium]
MTENFVVQADELMKKSVKKFKEELVTIRTSRATAALVEDIKVSCYNTTLPLKQVAAIVIPSPKTIEIRPWDLTTLTAIEKAIYQSSLGLTPVNDGKIIRLTIPPLTEERRQELVKHIHKLAEEFRISIRNDRRIVHENIKKSEREKNITEDQKYKLEDKLQRISEEYIKKINELVTEKEKEIMEIC